MPKETCPKILINKSEIKVYHAVAYPELVSRGVSKSRKFKWLVKVGACKDVNPLIKKKSWPGGGGGVSGQPENPPGYATAIDAHGQRWNFRKFPSFSCQLHVNAARVSHFLNAETRIFAIFASSIADQGRPWYIKVP